MKSKTDVSVTIPLTYLFVNEIQPYVTKVIESLKQTQLRTELVDRVELAIRCKTQDDVKHIFMDHDWTTYRTYYLNNARHIIVNLKNGGEINNQSLIERVNTGLISPEALVVLTPQEMYVERWQSLIEKKLTANQQLLSDPEATSNLFECGRCHKKKTTYFERQDRSADEPKTIHITCCFCGHRWRQ